MEHINAWKNFKGKTWKSEINVRDFIQENYEPYSGDEEFLTPATERTKKLMAKLNDLFKKEAENGGVLKVDTETVMTVSSHNPGYLDKENEIIVGIQTDEPLKRGVNPFGGLNMTRKACAAYNYELSPKVEDKFLYRTTHNDGVFRAYNPDIRAARHSGIITGLPDAYGRGRIIGDYRRVALYGVDFLIEKKNIDKVNASNCIVSGEDIRRVEELHEQIETLEELKKMALSYGFDISKPANDSKEAVQWLYFAYLGAIKEQNGAAMSLGRCSTFLDIYFTRDLESGLYTESQIQEIVDDFVMKLRMARHLRTPEDRKSVV